MSSNKLNGERKTANNTISVHIDSVNMSILTLFFPYMCDCLILKWSQVENCFIFGLSFFPLLFFRSVDEALQNVYMVMDEWVMVMVYHFTNETCFYLTFTHKTNILTLLKTPNKRKKNER